MMQPFKLLGIASYLLLTGCELFENGEAKKDYWICGNAYEYESDSLLNATKPRDTILSNDVYVKYVNIKGKYDVVVGSKNWSTEYEYKHTGSYTSKTPHNIVPTYEWSSKKVIALKYGCGGGYCSRHKYYLVGKDVYIEREATITYDSANNLISYLIADDSVVVENIVTQRRKAFRIIDSLPCLNPLTCIASAHFIDRSVIYEFVSVKNAHNIKVKRTFAIPSQLYK